MDAVTFQSEVLKIERLLYHVAYTALGNRQECADAVQEALLRGQQHRQGQGDARLAGIGCAHRQDARRRGRIQRFGKTVAAGEERGGVAVTPHAQHDHVERGRQGGCHVGQHLVR